MRILQIEKFFYNRGGSSRVFFDTIEGLRRRGNEVAEFSMQDGRNYPSKYEKYFAPSLPELKSRLSFREQFQVFKRLFKSEIIETKLTNLIDDFKPEVAHIHNAYHHLSASTFITLQKKNVPVVLTLHDVFPLCPNHSLLIGETLGEKELKNNLFNCLRYKCVDGKFLPSLAGVFEALYYRYHGVWKNIKIFICPSQFMADKMVEYGFAREKMRVIRNPFVVTPSVLPLGDKVVYLGRLHHEKGIKVFLRAAEKLRDLQLVVAGSGQDENWVNNFLKEKKLNNVERVGWVSGEKWKQIMNEARVVVVPSVFLENCSVSILEALSHGRLVVASDRGGNPEMIINGKTGFLCRPEDPDDLARAIREAIELPDAEAQRMIAFGRELVETNHNPTNYFTKLKGVYNEVIK
ncbi:MAG: glycosyltransferase [Patescibacteria group bacterium]|jgi:glycosyltransferase involved in cell wall biosynthesis